MLLKVTVKIKDLQELFFIQVSMLRQLSFMKKTDLSCQMGLFACIAIFPKKDAIREGGIFNIQMRLKAFFNRRR